MNTENSKSISAVCTSFFTEARRVSSISDRTLKNYYNKEERQKKKEALLVAQEQFVAMIRLPDAQTKLGLDLHRTYTSVAVGKDESNHLGDMHKVVVQLSQSDICHLPLQ